MPKRSVWGLLALLSSAFLLALSAAAATVSSDQAALAARGWVLRGGSVRGRMGSIVEKTTTFQATGGSTFYAAKMYGGGTVFLAGDTDETPVIAFTADATDYSTIDEDSPLWALLNRDAARRQVAAASTPSVVVRSEVTAANREWAALWAEGAAAEASPALAFLETGSGKTLSSKNIRVAPLVKTKWGQSGFGDEDVCFNYYTPKHAVCGCVATAMAQVMRYWKWPEGDVASVTRTCSIDGVSTNLTTQSGAFDWANMPETAFDSGSSKETQVKALGRLASDCGISVYMNYTTGTSGSGAATAYVPDALKDVFGYASAEWEYDYSSGLSASVFGRTLYANFDAGCPVEMSIYGSSAGGHAVVGDGYGFENGTPYIHLNMGWNGQKDMWYNVPNIDTDWYDFTVFSGVAYNIFPEETGLILAGRVVDGDGEPFEGAKVSVEIGGDEPETKEVTTGANGIYSFILPADAKYDVVAVGDCKMQPGQTVTETLTGVSLSDRNVWGKEIVLSEPTVCIGEAGYTSLDKALAAANDGDVLEIILPTELRKSVTITNSVTIVATNADAEASAVLRLDEAALTVTNATLSLSNVVFSGSSECLVDVCATGRLQVFAGVDLGLESDCVAVRTADAEGFVLSGPLVRGILLETPASPNAGDAFGSYACDEATARANVAFLSNAADEYGELRGTADGGLLKWANVNVPLADAAGYFVGADGETTNTSARIDRAFERFAAAWSGGELAANPELVIRKSGSLSRSFTVGADVRLTGENGAAFTNIDSSVAFVVTGGTMRVTGLAFENYAGNGLFQVAGGTNVIRGCAFRNITGTQVVGKYIYSGALAISRGLADVADATFENCRTEATGTVTGKKGVGGAISLGRYLAGADCALKLSGAIAITNCHASSQGGGVWAEKESRLELAGGDFKIAGNTCGSGSSSVAASDLYVKATNVTNDFRVTGLLTGDVGVYMYATAKGPGLGAFAVAEGLGAVELLSTSAVFFNDNATYAASQAAPTADGRAFVWEEPSLAPEPISPQDRTKALDLVIYPWGETNGFANIDDAFRAVTNDAVIAMRTNEVFVQSLTLTNYAVTLTTAADAFLQRCTLSRAATCSLTCSDAALTVSNLVIRGVYKTGAGDLGLNAGALIEVDGGSLTLEAGSCLEGVHCQGEQQRAASAVLVWNGGRVTVADGAQIQKNYNFSLFGKGAGILADGTNTCVVLSGGSVTSCGAAVVGGVFVGSGARLEIAGDATVTGNGQARLSGNAFDVDPQTEGNVIVSGNSSFVLTDRLTGTVGVGTASGADTSYVGRVEWAYGKDVEALTNSAKRIVRDGSSGTVCAVAVTNETETILLVWSTAIAADGSYTRVADGESATYWLVRAAAEPEPGPTPPEPTPVSAEPIAFKSVTRVSDTEWALVVTNRVQYCGYRLLWTDDLTKGFTSTGAWEQATASGEWATNVLFTAPAPTAIFWKAEGKDGEKPADE